MEADASGAQSRWFWLTKLFPLLALVWLVLPPQLVYLALITGGPLFGETPGPEEMAESKRLLWGAAVSATVPPLLGLLIALRYRRRVASWMFGSALFVGVLGAFFFLMTGVDQR